MSAIEFLDTNILVYAYHSGELHKQKIAQSLIERCLLGEIVLSSQVLAEFATTVLHKVRPAMRPADLRALFNVLTPIKLVPLDAGVVHRAVQAHEHYGLHFYDGLIVAAAERGGCERIWSEDLNAGQRYFGIVVENPFV